MNLSSKFLENAVFEISKLPGIGKKSALRMALFLLKQDQIQTLSLADSLITLRTKIKHCQVCYNYCDADLCSICESKSRERSIICVVEDTKDVMAIENTSQYRGIYHVLGGVISPLEGISPDSLNIDQLIKRIENGEAKEIILALSPTNDGDTTSFYIARKLKLFDLKITTIARGIPIGGELEYTDEITLGRSISRRTNYEN